MNIPNLRKKLLTRRAVFVAALALVLCALAALIGFCLPRGVEPTIPDAPITRAPTVTATPTLTATLTLTPSVTSTQVPPTLTSTATHTLTATFTPTLSPTLQNTDTPTPTRTPINTIVPGRNGTMPTTGAARNLLVPFVLLFCAGALLLIGGGLLIREGRKIHGRTHNANDARNGNGRPIARAK